LRTALCDRLGIDVPIVQAPVGSAAGPELAAAVSEAGGLGMLALTWQSPEQVRRSIRRTRELTNRPFGANLVLDFPVDDLLEVCLDEGVPVISTFWGDPAPMNARIHNAGALHLHTVGEVAEAVDAVAGGVDVVVAQGWEAGGHVRGTTTTMTLVPAVVDAVAPVPVLATGGIADGRGIAAVLALGAQGAMLGTRFLTAVEATTHAVYRQQLIAATGADAVHTRCFDGGWPDAPHRALRNATVRRWEAAGSPLAPGRPGEGDVIAVDAAGTDHQRYEDLIPLPGMTGDLADMAMYAGQSVNLVHEVLPAARLIQDLVEQATTIIDSLNSATSRVLAPADDPADRL
jgi:nitronate monooxygenase/enoyl-[acyl-carrier protein] reductase II